MSYRQLNIGSKFPLIKKLIERLEDHYLRDVHTMLRLPIPDCSLPAGCNFAIAQTLLATIAGVSSTLYPRNGTDYEKFKTLLKDYYPWKHEPTNPIMADDAASILYGTFRNPLVHDIGLDLKQRSKTQNVIIERMVTISGFPEETIEQIEYTSKRYQMPATITRRDDATVLLVEALYWGTRCMIENLVAKCSSLEQAESMLML